MSKAARSAEALSMENKTPSDFIEINFAIDTKAKKNPCGFAYSLLTSVRNVISAAVYNKDSVFGLAGIFLYFKFSVDYTLLEGFDLDIASQVSLLNVCHILQISC